MRPDGRRHTLKDLYHEDTYYEFLDRRWRWALISGRADPHLGARLRRCATG